MKRLLPLSLVLLCGCGLFDPAHHATPFGQIQPITTNWVGQVAVGDVHDPYFTEVGYLRTYELGLRSDGTVVWRTNTVAGDPYQRSSAAR